VHQPVSLGFSERVGRLFSTAKRKDRQRSFAPFPPLQVAKRRSETYAQVKAGGQPGEVHRLARARHARALGPAGAHSRGGEEEVPETGMIGQ
jgi:hypothetical protein